MKKSVKNITKKGMLLIFSIFLLVGCENKEDTTAPKIEIDGTSTYNSVEVTVKASDKESEITKYYFSLDNKNWEDIVVYSKKENEVNISTYTYKFKKLDANTDYNVYVKVENAAGLTSKKEITIKTTDNNETINDNINKQAKDELLNSAYKVLDKIYTYGCTIKSFTLLHDGDGWVTYSGKITIENESKNKTTLPYTIRYDDNGTVESIIINDEKIY